MTTRDKILEVFTIIREDASASYSEDNVFEHLIIPNGKKLDDSFKGKRYKIRFVNALQTTFAVCFPIDFYGKNWTLDALCAYIEDRSKNNAANLKMAQKCLAQSKRADMNILVFGNLLLLAPLPSLEGTFFWVYAAVPIAFNALMLRFKFLDISYHKKLIAIIESAAA